MRCIAAWALSSAVLSPLHTNVRLLGKREIKPPKTVCGCLCGGVIKAVALAGVPLHGLHRIIIIIIIKKIIIHIKRYSLTRAKLTYRVALCVFTWKINSQGS